eukprot:10572240-Ditylum_brightwellii.AAC.1
MNVKYQNLYSPALSYRLGMPDNAALASVKACTNVSPSIRVSVLASCPAIPPTRPSFIVNCSSEDFTKFHHIIPTSTE